MSNMVINVIHKPISLASSHTKISPMSGIMEKWANDYLCGMVWVLRSFVEEILALWSVFYMEIVHVVF